MASRITSVNPVNESCIRLSDGRYGGYKLDVLKQNLSPIEEKFVICPSCTGIMKNASFSAGKNMCESCCPETERSIPVVFVRETVNKLPCRCPLDTKGCGWAGVIGQLETHLSVCEHLMVPCPFVDYGCEVGLVKRLAMQSHLKEFNIYHITGRIMKLEEENKKAFGEISLLKQENVKVVNENKRAFEQMGTINLENKKLKRELDELRYNVWDEMMIHKTSLRRTINGKQLEGFQFTISGIDKLVETEIQQGPIFYLKRYMIQIEFEPNPFFLYIKRIPGPHDNELKNARVALVCYQFINATDSSVQLVINRNLNHSLIINKRSSFICNITGLNRFIVDNHLTVKVFFELVLETPCEVS